MTAILHPYRGRTSAGPTERFHDKISPEPNSGCWLWLGSGLRYGIHGVNGKHVRAHRYSYELHHGPIPDGMWVLHKCDVGFCVNPDHLFLGTPADNAADREAKGRGNQPRGERNGHYTKPWSTVRGERHHAHRIEGWGQGERNGRAKLTPDQVLAIRADARSNTVIGRELGVTKTTVRGIKTRRLWAHIP